MSDRRNVGPLLDEAITTELDRRNVGPLLDEAITTELDRLEKKRAKYSPREVQKHLIRKVTQTVEEWKADFRTMQHRLESEAEAKYDAAIATRKAVLKEAVERLEAEFRALKEELVEAFNKDIQRSPTDGSTDCSGRSRMPPCTQGNSSSRSRTSPTDISRGRTACTAASGRACGSSGARSTPISTCGTAPSTTGPRIAERSSRS